MKKFWVVGRITIRVYMFFLVWLIGALTPLMKEQNIAESVMILFTGYLLGLVANYYLIKFQQSERSSEGLIYLFSYLLFLPGWFVYANDFEGRLVEIGSALVIGLILTGFFAYMINRVLKFFGLMRKSNHYLDSGEKYRNELNAKNIRKGLLIFVSLLFISVMTELSPDPIFIFVWLIFTLIVLYFGLSAYRNMVYYRHKKHFDLKFEGKKYNQRYIDLYKERSVFWSGWRGNDDENSSPGISSADVFPDEKESWRIELEEEEELERQSRDMRFWGEKGQYDNELDEIDYKLGRSHLQRDQEDEFNDYERDIER